MRNFSYNATNQTIFEGYRVIALKNADMERLANAANMREPEISVTPETVVEPQAVVQETPVQNIPESPVVNNQPTMDNQPAQMEPQSTQSEVSAEPSVGVQSVAPNAPEVNNVPTPEPTSINPSGINIPEPIATPQQGVSVEQAPESHVQSDSNIFDAPEVRVQESVQSAPVQSVPVQSVPNSDKVIDLDEYMIKSQEIYNNVKREIEESLIKAQREQVNLVMQMMKNLEQLKVDNAAYSRAIDEVVNEEGFKKVA